MESRSIKGELTGYKLLTMMQTNDTCWVVKREKIGDLEKGGGHRTQGRAISKSEARRKNME